MGVGITIHSIELAEFHRQIIVFTQCKDVGGLHRAIRTGIRTHIRRDFMLSLAAPMLINLCMGVSLDIRLGRVLHIFICLAVAFITQTEETIYPEIVRIAFQLCHTHTQIF